MFTLDGLDHVAIRVRDVGESAAWYARVLGLVRMHEGVWGETPAVMAAPGDRRSGVAIFPRRGNVRGRGVEHIAFRVGQAQYREVKMHLARLDLKWVEQDHEIARSVYFYDPDGYELEVTTYDRM